MAFVLLVPKKIGPAIKILDYIAKQKAAPSSPPSSITQPFSQVGLSSREDPEATKAAPSSSPQQLHHFAASLRDDPGWLNAGEYSTLQLDPQRHKKEFDRVMSIVSASLSPTSKLKIEKIQVVWNRNLSRMFEGQIEVLKNRSSKPQFKPSWDQESNPSLRKQIAERFQTIVRKQGSFIDGCSIVPIFHGTKREAIASILRTGFAPLQTTDEGYIGTSLLFFSLFFFPCSFLQQQQPSEFLTLLPVD